MTDQALSQLLVELFAAIKLMSGYPMPATLPEIHQLPHAQLEARICAGNCSVKAFYLKGDGVFIDDALDLQHDLRARSILLHELVHHVQGVSGRFDSLSDCDAWYAREFEAYQIQNRYLHQEGSNVGYHMGGYVHSCALDADGK
jgi:hypothetical protein